MEDEDYAGGAGVTDDAAYSNAGMEAGHPSNTSGDPVPAHDGHEEHGDGENDHEQHDVNAQAGEGAGGHSEPVEEEDGTSAEAVQLAGWDYGAPESTEFCCRLRGLPWDSQPAHILRFFKGCGIVRNGLVMLFDTRGTGYASFASQADKDAALKLHRKHLGKRYIEVEACTGQEFEKNRSDVAPADGLVRSVLRLSGLPEDVSKESDILPLFRDHFSLAPTLDPRAVAEGLVAAGKPVAVMGQLDILASSAQGNSNAGRTKRGGANRRNRRGGAGAANKATAGGAGAASAASSSSSSSSAPADEAPSKDEAAHEEGSAAGEAGAGEGEGEEQQTVPDAGSSSSSSSASAAPAQAQAASIASAVADPEVPQTADDIGAHAGAVGSGSGATLCSSVYLGVSTETATYGRPNGHAYVVFASAEEALRAYRALQASPATIKGKAVTVAVTSRGEVYSRLGSEARRGLGTDADYQGVLKATGFPAPAAAASSSSSKPAAKADGDAAGSDATANAGGLSYEEMLSAFGGFELESPYVAPVRRASDGRLSGECYVVFASMEEAARALATLQDSPLNIGGVESKLRLSPAIKGEAYAALGGTGYVRRDAMSRTLVHLKGIPYSASPQEVQAFITAHSNSSGAYEINASRDVFVTMLPSGLKSSGEAFVVLPSEEAAVAVAASVSGQKMSKEGKKKTIEVTVTASPARRIELYLALSRPIATSSKDYRPGERDSADSFLRLRGLPFDVQEAHLEAFFEGFGVRRVILARTHEHKCSGEAFVELSSVAEAQEALCRNKGVVQPSNRYVEMSPANRREMKATLQLAAQRPQGATAGGRDGDRNRGYGGHRDDHRDHRGGAGGRGGGYGYGYGGDRGGAGGYGDRDRGRGGGYYRDDYYRGGPPPPPPGPYYRGGPPQDRDRYGGPPPPLSNYRGGGDRGDRDRYGAPPPQHDDYYRGGPPPPPASHNHNAPPYYRGGGGGDQYEGRQRDDYYGRGGPSSSAAGGPSGPAYGGPRRDRSRSRDRYPPPQQQQQAAPQQPYHQGQGYGGAPRQQQPQQQSYQDAGSSYYQQGQGQGYGNGGNGGAPQVSPSAAASSYYGSAAPAAASGGYGASGYSQQPQPQQSYASSYYYGQQTGAAGGSVATPSNGSGAAAAGAYGSYAAAPASYGSGYGAPMTQATAATATTTGSAAGWGYGAPATAASNNGAAAGAYGYGSYGTGYGR